MPEAERSRLAGSRIGNLSAIQRIPSVTASFDILRDGIEDDEFHPVDPEVTAHLIEALCEAWSMRRFVMRRQGVAKVAALIQRLRDHGLQPAPLLESPA